MAAASRDFVYWHVVCTNCSPQIQDKEKCQFVFLSLKVMPIWSPCPLGRRPLVPVLSVASHLLSRPLHLSVGQEQEGSVEASDTSSLSVVLLCLSEHRGFLNPIGFWAVPTASSVSPLDLGRVPSSPGHLRNCLWFWARPGQGHTGRLPQSIFLGVSAALEPCWTERARYPAWFPVALPSTN